MAIIGFLAVLSALCVEKQFGTYMIISSSTPRTVRNPGKFYSVRAEGKHVYFFYYTWFMSPIDNARVMKKWHTWLPSIPCRGDVNIYWVWWHSQLITENRITTSCSSYAWLINLMFMERWFPDMLNYAQVAALKKRLDNVNKENYKPVSILTALSKSLEKVSGIQLSSYFDSIFSWFLSGFRF